MANSGSDSSKPDPITISIAVLSLIVGVSAFAHSCYTSRRTTHFEVEKQLLEIWNDHLKGRDQKLFYAPAEQVDFYELDQAELKLRALLAEFRKDPRILLMYGFVFRERENYEAAERYFCSVLREEPGNVRAMAQLGSMLIEKGENGRGFCLLRRAKGIAKGNRDIRYTLAINLLHTGKTAEAIAELQATVQLDRLFYPAFHSLAEAYDQQLSSDDFDETMREEIRAAAINALKTANNLAPPEERRYFELGELLLEDNQLLEAIEQFQAAIQPGRRDCTDAAASLELVFRGSRRYEEAEALVNSNPCVIEAP
jgi:tetratricopeptide (TPR) repeat protein